MTKKLYYAYEDGTYSCEFFKHKVLVYKTYYKDSMLHNTDGPALDYVHGFKMYYVKGKRHRLDGPAVESPNGYKQYWVNDVEVTDKLKGIKEEDVPKYLALYML